MSPELLRALTYVANITIIVIAILFCSFSPIPVAATVVALTVSFGLQTIDFIRSIIGKPIFSDFANGLVKDLEGALVDLKREKKFPRRDLVSRLDHALEETIQKLTGDNVLRFLHTKGIIKESVSDEEEKMQRFVEWQGLLERVLSYFSRRQRK